MNTKQLFLIGGKEDKGEKPLLLKAFCDRFDSKKGPLILITGASRIPLEVGEMYIEIFNRLGVIDIIHLPLTKRSDCILPENIRAMERASAVFITGGNQVKLASILGGTPFFHSLKRKVNDGLLYGGTSAGASIASGLMIAGGRGGYNPRRNLVKITGGLGLIRGCIIDQHFRERNRLFRLASAVSANPEYIGLGIDEDTALIILDDRYCHVLGSNSATILNGNGITHTGYTEGTAEDAIPIFGLNLNVVTPEYGYDLIERIPILKKNNSSHHTQKMEKV